MFVYSAYERAVENAPYCVALGNFDGVHIGHVKLIKATVKKAKELNCKSMVYTFSVHPRKIFNSDTVPKLITNARLRAKLFEKHNLDSMYLEDFISIKNMDSEKFVTDILIKKFQIKCVAAGYNFRFGLNKQGSIGTLKSFGRKYGFEVLAIEPVKVENNIVSSSLIRELLEEGKVEAAKYYLGRYFNLIGIVEHGRKNGSKIGIRTANIKIQNDIVLPKRGVYLTNTIVDGKEYKSVTNIGINPTFKGEKLTIETHLIDFNGYIYGDEAEVIFLKWCRQEKCFKNTNELKKQINCDINTRIKLNI